MKKCLFCRAPLTGVRRTKKFCSDSHRAQFSRLRQLIVAKEQGLSETIKVSDWCLEHEMEKQYCSLMKHKKKG